MFANVGFSEILVLVIVGLVVLGPERLPEAMRWLASAIRKVKEFAGDAQKQLKDDFGTDLEEFREPLKQINELRGMTPRALVTKHLLDGDDTLFANPFDAAAPSGTAGAAGAAPTPSSGAGSSAVTPGGGAPGPSGAATPPPATPHRPPQTGAAAWDTDAT